MKESDIMTKQSLFTRKEMDIFDLNLVATPEDAQKYWIWMNTLVGETIIKEEEKCAYYCDQSGLTTHFKLIYTVTKYIDPKLGVEGFLNEAQAYYVNGKGEWELFHERLSMVNSYAENGVDIDLYYGDFIDFIEDKTYRDLRCLLVSYRKTGEKMYDYGRDNLPTEYKETKVNYSFDAYSEEGTKYRHAAKIDRNLLAEFVEWMEAKMEKKDLYWERSDMLYLPDDLEKIKSLLKNEIKWAATGTTLTRYLRVFLAKKGMTGKRKLSLEVNVAYMAY